MGKEHFPKITEKKGRFLSSLLLSLSLRLSWKSKIRQDIKEKNAVRKKVKYAYLLIIYYA